MTRTPLATGILSWDGSERRSRRYGHIVLDGKTFNESDHAKTYTDLALFDSLVGKKVKLEATVIKARKSAHIGDHLLGVFPSTPEVNESIVIGIGYLHKTDVTWGMGFELWPAEHLLACRPTFWLDPHTLFRLHDQTVVLFVEESDEDPLPMAVFKDCKDFVEIPEADGKVTFQHSDIYKGVEAIKHIEPPR